MRLFTSAVFIVSIICSWLVIDVLACKNDAKFLFKRMPPVENKRPRGSESPPAPPPKRPVQSTQSKAQSLNLPRQCLPIPPWMHMEPKKNIRSANAFIAILDGPYTHDKDVYKNPVAKIYKPESEVDLHAMFAEVSYLQKVGQYIDGGILGRLVVLLMKNMGEGLKLDLKKEADDAKFKELLATTRQKYLTENKMVHLDGHMGNLVHKPGEQHPSLIDWGHARYDGVPESRPTMAYEFRPDERLPEPPQGKISDAPKATFSASIVEAFILESAHTFLWGNAEANYYEYYSSEWGTLVLKVSRITGIRQHQTLLAEISYALAVDQFINVGRLTISKKDFVSYLMMKFPGVMEKHLPGSVTQEDKKKLQEDAILRYKTQYHMINTRIKDEYFIYNMTENKAYIYDWSCARHEDLPDGTLRKFCPVEPNEVKEDVLLGKIYNKLEPYEARTPFASTLLES
ncbi:hypothetical protein AX14_005191 [Amanita brunnescens Koide BX004]|nr:hypothetical protein AX14_005191 [Amanita brunnescens Koide BX004]